MKKSVVIHGHRYKVGGSLYYKNEYGQGMYGEIVGVYENSGRAFLFVQRREWPRPEAIDINDYVLTRYFPPGIKADTEKIS